MKKASFSTTITRISKLAPELGGVFLTSDLASIICTTSDLNNARMIRRLVQDGFLTRIIRGVYVTQEFNLDLVATKINPGSVISLDSVLARTSLIGSVPQRYLSVVQLQRNRTIKVGDSVIHFYAIDPTLYFGFARGSNGVNVADAEKAYLDLLHYHIKGARFPIDPTQEVRIEKLDRQKIDRYLTRYKNKRFVTFVRRLLNERT